MSLNRIELNLQSVQQLFNSMDPSPFHERDLDHDAEEFIVSWAQEHPAHLPVTLVVHLRQAPPSGDPAALITESIHHYFDYKSDLNRREIRRLLREGWVSLLIGLGFLIACSTAARFIAPHVGPTQTVVREGLTIIGWVAMWRPLDIYLYRWWPLSSLGKIYRKLSTIPIEVSVGAQASA